MTKTTSILQVLCDYYVNNNSESAICHDKDEDHIQSPRISSTKDTKDGPSLGHGGMVTKFGL